METFQSLVEKKLRDIDSTTVEDIQSNLSQREQNALKSLRKNPHIIIRPADKGGTVVVLDRKLYNKQIFTMLSDSDTYIPLNSDPTNRISLSLVSLLLGGVDLGILTLKQKEYLLVPYPMCPSFHTFPKTLTPPMRPIFVRVGSLVERVCIWLDNLLQPMVQRVWGRIKDTKELLQTFYDFEWKNKYIWVTCDIVALYTSIATKWTDIVIFLILLKLTFLLLQNS